MSTIKHTPGPWFAVQNDYYWEIKLEPQPWCLGIGDACQSKHLPGGDNSEANARLMAASPDLIEALHEGRRAIGDHIAPGDCYATGPMTGDHFRDLVQCPACSFIAMYEAAIAKATGEAA